MTPTCVNCFTGAVVCVLFSLLIATATATVSDTEPLLFTGALRSLLDKTNDPIPTSTSSEATAAAAAARSSSIDDATLQQIVHGALHDEQMDAMYVLAMLKYYGQRVDQDVAGAIRLIKKLAHRGHADAEFTLAVLYASRIADDGSVAQNDRMSTAWLASSASHGHVDAKWMLAIKYNEGRGVPLDTSRALELLVDAVTHHHHARAMFHLGVMYEYGRGVERDASKAAVLYQQASDLHIVDATYYLALLYASGRGVPKNTNHALLLLHKAADDGHAPAMLCLGELHADGESGRVAVDYVTALHFLKRAAVVNDPRVSVQVDRRVQELEWVLSQANAMVEEQERTLGVPLRVQVGTIESR